MEYSDNYLLDLSKKDTKSYNESFTLLVKQFGPRLFPQINRLIKNKQNSEDCIQNIFIKVFKNFKNFRGESSIYSWLYRIANNETLNYLKKEKNRFTVDLKDLSIENISEDSNFLNISTEIIEDHLIEAIQTLPLKQAQIFELKFFQDLKFSEISKLLNTTEGGLKANYHLAVKKIEKYLSNAILY